jgi:HlyD family secretion protein
MNEMLGQLRRRHAMLGVLGVILCVVIVLGAVRLMGRTTSVPTVEVKLEEFVDSQQQRGEVKALRAIAINAPAQAGDLLIVKIAADGAQVKRGDTVVEFDKSHAEQDLAQYASTMKSAQAEIDQSRAKGRLTEEEDVTAVMKAKYDLESAKLEAGKQEIISAIDGEKAELKVSDAEQKLRDAEEKQKSDRLTNQATINSSIQSSKKAAFDLQRSQDSVGKLTLRAPVDGMISLVQAWRGNMVATLKLGDRAWPGAAVAEIPDVSTLRVEARVDETERGRLRVNQPVNVQLDAIPDKQFTGHIDQISPIASTDFTGGWPFRRNFSLEVLLDQSDPRIRPGMSAQINIVVEKIAKAITIPAQSSFQKSGRTVVYVLQGSNFEEKEIEIGKRSGDQIMVSKGLRVGDRVALKDPSNKE